AEHGHVRIQGLHLLAETRDRPADSRPRADDQRWQPGGKAEETSRQGGIHDGVRIPIETPLAYVRRHAADRPHLLRAKWRRTRAIEDDAQALTDRIFARHQHRDELLIHDHVVLTRPAIPLGERSAAHEPDPERLEVTRADSHEPDDSRRFAG